MITGIDGGIIDTNQAFTRITGYSHDEVRGKTTPAQFWPAIRRVLSRYVGSVCPRRGSGRVKSGTNVKWRALCGHTDHQRSAR